jgi:hypothetical protein
MTELPRPVRKNGSAEKEQAGMETSLLVFSGLVVGIPVGGGIAMAPRIEGGVKVQ